MQIVVGIQHVWSTEALGPRFKVSGVRLCGWIYTNSLNIHIILLLVIQQRLSASISVQPPASVAGTCTEVEHLRNGKESFNEDIRPRSGQDAGHLGFQYHPEYRRHIQPSSSDIE